MLGVPQGSIIGPALFLLYVNKLPDVITKSQVVKFADETKVYKEVKSQDDGAALPLYSKTFTVSLHGPLPVV